MPSGDHSSVCGADGPQLKRNPLGRGDTRMKSSVQALRQAAIWAVAVEAPLALFAALTALPAFYRAMPIVLTAHLPGIMLLDSLGLCCGLGSSRIISDRGPSLEPPLLLSVAVLALANILVLCLVLWLGFLLAGRRSRTSSRHAAA